MSHRAGRPHKNRYPATHSTNEEENNERKKKYVSQYIRKKNKKGKETAIGECRGGYTTRSRRGSRIAGHALKRITRTPTSTRSKREEVRANRAGPPQPRTEPRNEYHQSRCESMKKTKQRRRWCPREQTPAPWRRINADGRPQERNS